MHDADLSNLSTVARFTSAAEARVACDYLSAHGVEALVMEQDRLRFDPLRPGKTPGVRVMVRGADESAARELLAAVETAVLEDGVLEAAVQNEAREDEP